MSSQTKDRRETEKGLEEFGCTVNGTDGPFTVYDRGYCGAR